ncbi:hypothetical protein [Kitasatospora mediocidica]|uniref:hypothetical protein n=1 Tax=Kitasatospora mediocidica TaxID=58352 RepID=UPI000691C4D0|nr:hypothetical protein [Kitasatospora mediocidica]
MGRVEIDDQWQPQVEDELLKLFKDRLGPDIARDAQRYCPERTGALKESIENHMEDRDLIISATGGDDGRSYAAYVELGTRPHIIRSHGPWPLRSADGEVFGPVVHHPGTVAKPFLRPALFQERGD